MTEMIIIFLFLQRTYSLSTVLCTLHYSQSNSLTAFSYISSCSTTYSWTDSCRMRKKCLTFRFLEAHCRRFLRDFRTFPCFLLQYSCCEGRCRSIEWRWRSWCGWWLRLGSWQLRSDWMMWLVGLCISWCYSVWSMKERDCSLLQDNWVSASIHAAAYVV